MLSEGGSQFGWDVSTAGDVNGDGFGDVIVTDAYFDNGGSQNGAAWVFAGSSDGLGPDAIWEYESNNPIALFGISADSAGDVNGDGFDDIVVGADRYKEPDWPNSRGAAYVFHGSPDGLSPEPDSFFTTTVDQPGAGFGQSVAGAGDVNGDGYDDVAVGVGRYDGGDGEARGALFVYYGSSEGLEESPDIVPASLDIGGYGWDLATAGDVNGDGFADLIAGGVGYAGNETELEAAHLYLGTADGVEPLPYWSIVSDQPPPTGLARSVAGAGDVNGDGYDDILIGASGYVRPGLPDGAAFLYLGSPSGPSEEPDWAGYADGYVQPNEHQIASYGGAVDIAGDVDGDGYDDIVIEANNYVSSVDAPWHGAIFVYRGSPTGPAETPEWIGYPPDEHWAHLGFPQYPVARAGDVNGDGYADILVGDTSYEIADELGGAAAAYYGGPADADDDDADDDTSDDDTADDDAQDDDTGDDDSADDDSGDDSGGTDDDSIPDTQGSRDDSLVQDDNGPCGC